MVDNYKLIWFYIPSVDLSDLQTLYKIC
jgi:hypothetical protein